MSAQKRLLRIIGFQKKKTPAGAFVYYQFYRIASRWHHWSYLCAQILLIRPAWTYDSGAKVEKRVEQRGDLLHLAGVGEVGWSANSFVPNLQRQGLGVW